MVPATVLVTMTLLQQLVGLMLHLPPATSRAPLHPQHQEALEKRFGVGW